VGKLRFVLPNTFTSLNFLLGVFSICWTTGAFGSFSTADQIRMGAYFVMLCALFDKLDGFAARLVLHQIGLHLNEQLTPLALHHPLLGARRTRAAAGAYPRAQLRAVLNGRIPRAAHHIAIAQTRALGG
jgi:hypothetical protein